jgi:hypothetical protein
MGLLVLYIECLVLLYLCRTNINMHSSENNLKPYLSQRGTLNDTPDTPSVTELKNEATEEVVQAAAEIAKFLFKRDELDRLIPVIQWEKGDALNFVEEAMYSYLRRGALSAGDNSGVLFDYTIIIEKLKEVEASLEKKATSAPLERADYKDRPNEVYVREIQYRESSIDSYTTSKKLRAELGTEVVFTAANEVLSEPPSNDDPEKIAACCETINSVLQTMDTRITKP